MISFKVGHPFGKVYEENADIYSSLGDGHAHPDAGAVEFRYKGEILLLDEGYSLMKLTSNQNVLTFDDGSIGQYGESMWYNGYLSLVEKGTSRLVASDFSNKFGYEYLAGNISRMYPLSTNVNLHIRHLIWIKKKYLIVIDDVKFNNGTKRKVVSNWHGKANGRITLTSVSGKEIETLYNGTNAGYVLFSRSSSLSLCSYSGIQNILNYGGSEYISHLRIETCDEVNSVVLEAFFIPFGHNESFHELKKPFVVDVSERKRKITFVNEFELELDLDAMSVFVVDWDLVAAISFSIPFSILIAFCLFCVIAFVFIF